MSWPWDELEIAPGSDRDAIRRGYARKLKRTNPEDDPDGFKRLRAAYDAALQRATWRQVEAHEEEQLPEQSADQTAPAPEERELAMPDSPRPPVGRHGWQPPQQDAAEAALHAERQQDFADLEAHLAALAVSLEGPWAGDARLVEERFTAVMQSPALMELGVREQVEARIAALAARTIPHGDALIEPAAKMFGWFRLDPHTWHGPALAAVLNRIEEWRIVEQLGKPGHPLHLGWRALTKAPPPAWRWRINAARPGVARQVRSLLGLDGTKVADGLRHSFNKDAIARWQAYLAKPRLTFGILMLPLVLLAIVVCAAPLVAAPHKRFMSVLWAAGGIIALTSPIFALFLLPRWRGRWRAVRADRPAWLGYGWLFLFLAIAAAAAPAAQEDWSFALAVAAMGLTAIWSAIARSDAASPGRADWAALAYVGAIYVVCGSIALVSLDYREGLLLTILAVLALFLRLSAAIDIAHLLQRWLREHAGPILSIATIVGVGMLLYMGEPLKGAPRAFVITGYAAFALTMLLLQTSAIRRAGNGATRLFRIGSGLALLFGLIALAPDSPRAPPPSRFVPPIATAPPAMVQTPESVLTGLAEANPGLGKIQQGNPALWSDLLALAHDDIAKGRSDRIGDDVFALLNRRYHAMLPHAGDALVARGMRMRLAALTFRGSLMQGDCLSKKAEQLVPPPDDYTTSSFFDVLSSPPRAKGMPDARVPSEEALIQEGAALTHLGVDRIRAGLSTKASGVERCNATIAYLTALTRRPDAEIGAFVRQSEAANKKRR